MFNEIAFEMICDVMIRFFNIKNFKMNTILVLYYDR